MYTLRSRALSAMLLFTYKVLECDRFSSEPSRSIEEDPSLDHLVRLAQLLQKDEVVLVVAQDTARVAKSGSPVTGNLPPGPASPTSLRRALRVPLR